MSAKTTRDLVTPVAQGGGTIEVTDLNAIVNSNDLENATHKTNSDVTRRDINRKALGRVYGAEQQVQVMIAPMYKAYFGTIMHVSINGISCSVPCDGRPYAIPDTFAAEVQGRLRAINEQQAKQERFSDIGRNNESSPGELTLH